MKGYAQVAERRLTRTGQLEPDRAAETLRVIGRQSEKLNTLIGRLLDVSRIEEGKLTLELQTTDMAALVGEVVLAARMRDATHAITLVAPPGLQATIDPIRIEQVVTNLVDNAIKYSQDERPVEMVLSQTSDGLLELAIRDYGIGIPPERREHIFERYYQAHGDGYRSGLGLGLYVSYQIIKLHGGEIRAEFPDEGGTRFVVQLPNGH
jgi:signal transduction histidine kinase